MKLLLMFCFQNYHRFKNKNVKFPLLYVQQTLILKKEYEYLFYFREKTSKEFIFLFLTIQILSFIYTIPTINTLPSIKIFRTAYFKGTNFCIFSQIQAALYMPCFKRFLNCFGEKSVLWEYSTFLKRSPRVRKTAHI